MSMAPEAIESHVDASAALIGLPLAAEHRPGVLLYFGLVTRIAQPLMDFKLAIDEEPAAVFVPVEPQRP